MFPKLIRNNRLDLDIKKYKDAIDKIENKKIKSKYEILLKEFIGNCKLIDNAHSHTNNGRIDPRNVRDTVSSINTQRQQFEKLLKDLDNT